MTGMWKILQINNHKQFKNNSYEKSNFMDKPCRFWFIDL